jgi:C4-dicarboxylate-specific signal transduction histidine kinase
MALPRRRCEPLSDREISFMGKITAGMTHEIRNVYAIIRESSGLMEDILAITPGGSFKHREKFLHVISTIQEQVNRGVELATQLNRFAHSMDEPLVDVDLDEQVTHTVLLMQRFARLKQVELKIQPSEVKVVCATDPFRFQMVLATCIGCCIGGLGKGDTLLVRTCQSPEGGRVTVHTACAEPDGGEASEPPVELGELSDLMERLGIVLETWLSRGQRGVSLALPGGSPSRS